MKIQDTRYKKQETNMRQYLSTLHKRPHKHKKRFALLASGGFTLLIFAIWATVNFSGGEAVAANANMAIENTNPFGSLFRGIESGFNELRESILNIYGRPH